MKSLLEHAAKRLFRIAGLDVRNRRSVYADHLEDLARILNGVPEPVILDVGANRGDTVAQYRQIFPKSQIYAFEPTPELSAKLSKRFGSDPRVRVVPQAISDKIGTNTFYLMSNNLMNSILLYKNIDVDFQRVAQQELIEVPTTTITDYCNEFSINTVHILKIDIQGSERLALAGAKSMIDEGRIEAIYLEIHFFQEYANQSTFGELETLLRSANYRLYGFYDLNRESNGCLYYCKALYISKKLRANLKDDYLHWVKN